MSKSLGNTAARVSRAYLSGEKIKVLGRREPRTVGSGSPLAAALARMREGEGEPVLVCDDGRLAGIVTERDIVTKVLAGDGNLERPVDTVMSPDPGTLTDEASLRDALEMMDRGGYRNIPLVDGEGKLAGIVGQQDILEYVAESFPQEILNLPPRPHQLMDQAEGA